MIVSVPRYLSEVFFRYKSRIMLTILGLSMIIIGFLEMPFFTDFYSITNGKTGFAAYAVGTTLMIFGVMGILSAQFRNGTFAAGIMTLGMVIHFVFFIALLFPDSVLVDPEDEGYIDNYETRLVFYLLEAFCIFFALKMIMGSTHNTIRIVLVELAFVIVYIVVYFVKIHHGLSPNEAISELAPYNSTVVLMIISIICLNMSDSKYIMPMTRLRLNVQALETSTVTASETYMMRDSLYQLLSDPSEWGDSDDPEIEKELNIILYNNHRRESLVIRKWVNDETLTATFRPRDLKVSLYNYLNFPIVHIACEGGADKCLKVRIYSRNGFFVDVRVRDEHIRKYRTMNEVGIMLGLVKRGVKVVKKEEVEEFFEEEE